MNAENAFFINSLQNKVSIDVDKRVVEFPLIFYPEGLALKDNTLSVDAKITIPSYQKSSLQVFAEGTVANFQLTNGTTYLGNISSGSFDSDILIDWQNKNLQTSLTVSASDLPINQLVLKVALKSNWLGSSNFLNCIHDDKCDFG